MCLQLENWNRRQLRVKRLVLALLQRIRNVHHNLISMVGSTWTILLDIAE